MTAYLPTLPFLFSNPYETFLETTGVARIIGEMLILEFHQKDGFLGWLEAEVKTVKIPLAALESAILQQGWLRSCLVFQIKSQTSLTVQIADQPLQFQLTLCPQDQQLAEHWIAFLQKQFKGSLRHID
jgi:hypothetical protein